MYLRVEPRVHLVDRRYHPREYDKRQKYITTHVEIAKKKKEDN